MDGQFNHLNLAPELFINGDNAWLRETYNDNGTQHSRSLKKNSISSNDVQCVFSRYFLTML